jgi:hypothetical protein
MAATDRGLGVRAREPGPCGRLQGRERARLGGLLVRGGSCGSSAEGFSVVRDLDPTVSGCGPALCSDATGATLSTHPGQTTRHPHPGHPHRRGGERATGRGLAVGGDGARVRILRYSWLSASSTDETGVSRARADGIDVLAHELAERHWDKRGRVARDPVRVHVAGP